MIDKMLFRNKKGDYEFIIKLILILIAAAFMLLLIKKLGGTFIKK